MSIYVPPRRMSLPAAGHSESAAGTTQGMKAGPVGPGAGVLMTEWLLPQLLPQDQQRKAARALAMGTDVPYIRMAERAISGNVAGSDLLPGLSWHLEDPDGETIAPPSPKNDGYSGDPRALEAYTLVSTPTKYMDIKTPIRTRRQLWEITSRHMGLAGYAFWVLDALDGFGIPRSCLYVRPDRIIPDLDGRGVLTQWLLDPQPGPSPNQPRGGTPLSVSEVLQFQFQPPDYGYLPTGLVESAILKAQLAGAIDKHFATVISGGGRLSGIISPKTGVIEDDGVYAQMVRDWRNITEQPESGKRVQIVRAPVEFTRTVATTVEMSLIEFLKQNEADLLTIWGVPLSQLGGYTPTGLNSGDTRKYDRQAMWENAILQRAAEMQETIQSVLDRYEAVLGGWSPQLIFDVPTLADDDAPRYDKLSKSQFVPMKNFERRALIGLDPLGDDRDDDIVMPATMTQYDALGVPPPSPFGLPPAGADAGTPPKPTPPTPTPPTPTPEKPPTPAAPGSEPVPAAAKTKAKDAVVKGSDVTPAVLAALRKQWPAPQLVIAKQGTWKYDPAYPLDKIDAARRPVARNPQKVSAVEAALSVGAPIDPVVLINVKRLGTGDRPTEPIDGWHRLLAAQHAGLDAVPAYIGKGDDAWTRALLAFNDTIPTPDSPGAGKARGILASMQTLRETVGKTMGTTMRAAVSGALESQRRDVIARVRTKYDRIVRKPRDRTLWWDADTADEELAAALTPAYTGIATTVRDHIETLIPAPASKAAVGGPPHPVVVQRVIDRAARRVTQINTDTRDQLAELIFDGVAGGMSPAGLGDLIETWTGWDEYRAERIADTELMFAYNAAAIASYDDLGVQEVEAIDGEDDEECAARNGQIFTVEEADGIEDHPNGTLDWMPVLSDAPVTASDDGGEE